MRRKARFAPQALALLLACPLVFAADSAPSLGEPRTNTSPAFHVAPIKAKKKKASGKKAAAKKKLAEAPKESAPRPATRVDTSTAAETVTEPAATPADDPAPATAVPVPAPEIRSAPPEEFAALLEPQRTAIDVYYGGEFLLTTLAEYTPDSIEFIEPAAVIARLPNVVSRLALTNHLTGQLSRNSELTCRGEQQSGCGTLTPDFIGVIFDETRFRADLFVHPEMLMTTAAPVSPYLPSPATDQTGLSLVQNINAVSSIDALGNNSHNIAGTTHVGSGMQRVYSSWHNTDYQDFSVEELAWQKDTHRHEYNAGLFRARPGMLSFVRDEYLAGAGFGRSLKTRTDIEQVLGTEIVVFLTSRSQVDIYKDGRLLSSRFYPAGKQVLDTSRLPSGAYDIEVRIIDASGQQRSQMRFFSRSSLFAPKDIPLYHLEAGLVVNPDPDETLPRDDGNWQARSSYRYRYREDIGLSAGLAATDTHALLEGGAGWLHPAFQASALAMLSTQGDKGIALHAFGRWRDLSGTASHRRVWAEFAPGETDDYQLVGSDVSQQYATLSYPVLGGMLQASADINQSSIGNSELYSLRYLQPWRLGWLQTVNLVAEVARQDGDLFTQIGIELQHSTTHWSGGGNIGAQSQDMESGGSETRVVGSLNAGWRDADIRPEDIEVQARVTADESSTVAGLEGTHASHLGRLEIGVEHVDSETLTGARSSASYDTNIVATRNGVTFGGQQLAPSAVVIDIRGSARDALFDVLIDGRRVVSAPAGKRTIVPLAPYARYRIQLLDRGTTFMTYDDKPRDVVIYPGNVLTLGWEVENVMVGVGRIILTERVCSSLDETCHDIKVPLRSAMIGGTAGFAMTDEDGRFQAEMTASTRQISAKKRSISCDMTLAEPRLVNGIADFGDIPCVPATAEPGTDDDTSRDGAGHRIRENDPISGQRIDQAAAD
ncbi:MAG: TcfC E-set like domain-containing protein [Pseudomonadota bacterium]